MKRNIFLWAMLLLGVCGCSQIDGEVSFDPSQIYIIEVTANNSSDSDNTRVSINTSADTWSLSWESKDVVTGWQGTTTLNQFSLAEIDSSNSKSATFTGEATMGSARLIYPYNAETATDESGNYLIDLSTQSADMSSKYSNFADKYMYMVSDMFSIVEGGAVIQTPSMSHLLAIMELDISVMDIDNGDNFVVGSFEIDGLESLASLDFSTAELSTTTNNQKITVTVDNASGLSSESEQLIPFAVLPFTATADTEFTITLNFTNGSHVTIAKCGPEEGELPFAAGTHNYLTASFGMDDVEGYTASTHPYLSDYSSTSYPTDTDTWTIYDESANSASDFDGLQSALSSANSESREISLVFPNLTEMPTASSYSYGALNNCKAIMSISLPEATSIGSYAFRDCDALVSAYLPKITSIGAYAFYDCDAISSLNLPVTTSIGNYAFYSCYALKTVDISEIVSIGNYAFTYCSVLASLDLPKVTSVGIRAFQHCYLIESINLPLIMTISEAAFEYCKVLKSLYLPLATSFGTYAFQHCYELESINLPEATSIGNYAFQYCYALEAIDLPKVTSVGNCAFQKCSALDSVNLPKVTSLGYGTFSSCTNLETVKLATDSGVVLSSIGGTSTFSNASDIDLTLGSSNASLVSGTTLTVSSYSFTFKSITILE